MWPNPLETADLVTFTEETHNGNLHFCTGQLIAIFIINTNFATVIRIKGVHDIHDPFMELLIHTNTKCRKLNQSNSYFQKTVN